MPDADRRDRDLVAAYAAAEAAHELARRARARLSPPPPVVVGRFRLALHHRPRATGAGSLWGWAPRPGGGLGVWLVAPGGAAAPGVLTGMLAHSRLLALHLGAWDGAEPGAALGRVHDALAGLSDPPPLVGLLYAALDGHEARVTAARGGLPAPVLLPADGPAKPWGAGGPFLGAFPAKWPATTLELSAGDRLLFRTGLPPVGADALPDAAEAHRGKDGREYADAVARELAAKAPEEDELTLLVVEVA